MKKALIVIDIQNDTPKNYKEIIADLNKSIDWAVTNNIPVVYIRHENLSAGTKVFKPNTLGSELAMDLHVVSENIFTKYKSNALTCEEFTNFMNEYDINELYITGGDATICVKSTCFNLCKANYKVNVLSDCITCYNKKKIDEMLTYYESKGCNLLCVDDL